MNLKTLLPVCLFVFFGSATQVLAGPGCVYGNMTANLINKGPVLSQLGLSTEQKQKIANLYQSQQKKVMKSYMKGMSSCGECPASAIQTKKYPAGSAGEFVVYAEASSFSQSALKKHMKKVLDKKQYKLYAQGMKVLVDYQKSARKLLKAKKQIKLDELHAKATAKLDKIFNTAKS